MCTPKQVYEWVEVWHYCWPWHLDVGEWSNLCPEHFTAGEMATRNVFETDLDSLEKSLWNLPGIKLYFLSYPACTQVNAQTTLFWKQVIHHHAEVNSVIILHLDDKCTWIIQEQVHEAIWENFTINNMAQTVQ
jgi:hypothetical protein